MEPTPVALLLLAVLLLVAVGFIIGLRARVLALEDTVSGLETEKHTIYSFLDRLGDNITQGGAEQDPTMEMIVDFAMEATGAEAACLFVRERGGDALRARVVRGLFPPLKRGTIDKVFAKRKYVEDLVKKITIEPGEGIIGEVAVEQKPVLIRDASSDERLKVVEESGIPVRDFLAVPLKVRSEYLGVLVLVNKEGDQPFNESDRVLCIAMSDQAAVTLDLVRLYKVKAEQQRLEHELELARTFQSLLLPRERPHVEGLLIGDFYRPAMEVGGDYFDYVEIDDEHLGIAVGDVSGKGIPGALVMASVRATLRAEARLSLSPKTVLQRVNDLVARDTKDNVFITMTYAVLNRRTGVFRYCRAGHEPLLCCHAHARELASYTPEGIALGLLEGDLFNITEEHEIDLNREETVVLYTDGVIEAMNAHQEEYGEERFHRILTDHVADDPQPLIEKIIADIEDFTRGLPQHDDMTLVVLGWRNHRKPRQEALEAQANTA